MRANLDWRPLNHRPAATGPVCMKPVAILQHEASQGPGILLDHLRQQEIAHVLLDPCAEGSAPANARDYSGIVVLGSNHGVNDGQPWIESERRLLQEVPPHHGS